MKSLSLLSSYFFFLCLSFLNKKSLAYVLTVPEGETECVYEEFSRESLLPGELEDTVPTEVSLGFVVKPTKLKRGRYDPKVNFIIKGPHGEIITEQQDVQDQDVKFYAHGVGTYSACFTTVVVQHALPDFRKAKVDVMYFTPIHLIDDPGVIYTPHGNEGARGNHILDTESLDVAHGLVLDMKAKISLILQEQRYLKHREARHRETVDSTNSRTLMWAIVEFLAFAAANTLQVYFVQRFFSTPR